jgi:hypothetical protein
MALKRLLWDAAEKKKEVDPNSPVYETVTNTMRRDALACVSRLDCKAYPKK